MLLTARSERNEAEMAQRTIVEMIDDLDQKPIKQGEGETVSFGLEKVEYTIDLSKTNAAKLRKAMEPYVAAARPVGGKQNGRRRGRGRSSSPEYSAKAVRAWAEANGVAVPARGRIPQAVIDQFRSAGN
jgi:hypothetical protein